MRYDYEKQYREEINTHEEYRTSITEFMTWLGSHFRERVLFFAELKRYIDNPEEWRVYYMAVDYSITAIMVKWFAHFHR